MFNRKKDPNNIEELMIAEYYRQIDGNRALVNELNKVRKDAEDTYAELMDLLRDEENRSAHLQAIIDKDEGIVDLQEPILLHKSTIAGDYYFKDWLEEHASDEGTDEGLDAYLNALNSDDEKCINWFCEHGKNSYKSLVTITAHLFKFTLKVPVFGIFAYDPEYSKTQLVILETNYKNDCWMNMTLEAFNHSTAAKIREIANIAYKEYKDALDKQTKQDKQES